MKKIICDRCGKDAEDGMKVQFYSECQRGYNEYDICKECYGKIYKWLRRQEDEEGNE